MRYRLSYLYTLNVLFNKLNRVTGKPQCSWQQNSTRWDRGKRRVRMRTVSVEDHTATS